MMEEKEGFIQESVNGIITLIVGVGVAALILIFVGALGGQTYTLVEQDINDINNANIRTSVTSSIESSFEALENTGDYLPIVVLAIIITIVLSLILGLLAIGQIGGGRGGFGGGAL